jgi:hypothetical protein
MNDPIQTIRSLTGCTEEQANKAFDETEDIIEAVDRLLEKKPSPADKFLSGKKRPREVTPEETVIGPIRTMLKTLDEKTSTMLYRPVRGEQAETQDPLVEKVLQSSYFQECQLPSLQSKVEKQETVCQ